MLVVDIPHGNAMDALHTRCGCHEGGHRELGVRGERDASHARVSVQTDKGLCGQGGDFEQLEAAANADADVGGRAQAHPP